MCLASFNKWLLKVFNNTIEVIEAKDVALYIVVQKNACMFEFRAFLPPMNLGLQMHSPSALMEHVSLNLARIFFSRPCRANTQPKLSRVINR